MINSWTSLIHALDQMRQLQRNPHTAKTPDLFFRLKKLEAEVDLCIEERLKKWAREDQPELEIH